VILELQKHETGLFNPIVLGMVKKFPAFYKTWNIHCSNLNSPSMNHTLSQLNPTHTSVQCILILPSHMCSGIPSSFVCLGQVITMAAPKTIYEL